jgi:hypothetical protein
MPNTLTSSHGAVPVARLCELFQRYVEHGEIPADENCADRDPFTPDQLAGLLWDCTAIMPGTLCLGLGTHRGSNYAQGVRRMQWMSLHPSASA